MLLVSYKRFSTVAFDTLCVVQGEEGRWNGKSCFLRLFIKGYLMRKLLLENIIVGIFIVQFFIFL